jgi:hypothetical protein
VKVSGVRASLYTALVGAYVLHSDLWLWDDPSRRHGLPVGLTYHVVYCLLVAALLALLVRFAWPSDLDAETGEPPAR